MRLIDRRRALWSLAGLASAQSASAEAPDDFKFREIQACSLEKDAYRTPDSISTRRSKETLVVRIEASLNCGAAVVPKIDYNNNGSVSISLSESYKQGDPIAACNCMRQFEVVLTRRVQPRKAIYLVKQGAATAHASAA